MHGNVTFFPHLIIRNLVTNPFSVIMAEDLLWGNAHDDLAIGAYVSKTPRISAIFIYV